MLPTGPIPPVFEADKKDIPALRKTKTLVCRDFFEILATKVADSLPIMPVPPLNSRVRTSDHILVGSIQDLVLYYESTPCLPHYDILFAEVS